MQGIYSKLGLALQTDLTTIPAAPTISLRPKTLLNPMPEVTRTEEEVATGTRFGTQSFIQGFASSDKQITASATLRDIPVLIQALLGPVDAQGNVQTRADNYGALMPQQPLCVWQETPLSNIQMPGAQISRIQISVSTRQNAEVQVTLKTGRVIRLDTSVVFPPVADGKSAGQQVMQFLHGYMKVNGVKVAPEQFTITIEQKLADEDGAQGLDVPDNMYVLGFTADGTLTAQIEYTLNESGANKFGGNLKAMVDSTWPDPATGVVAEQVVEAGFSLGGKQVVFELPNAEVSATNIPTDMGRWTVGFTAKGTGLGITPINVKLPVA